MTSRSIVVAMTSDMPMTGVENGRIVGVDGGLISAIARRLGLTAEPALMPWAETAEAVRSGRADVVIGGMAWSRPRQAVMCLTDAIYYTSPLLTQKRGRNIDSTEALKGKSFGTVAGFSFVPAMRALPGVKEIKLYDTSEACLLDLRAGGLDAALLDPLAADYELSRHPEWCLKNVPMKPDRQFRPQHRDHAVIGVREGDCSLFQGINHGVRWVWETGYNRQLLLRYGAGPRYLEPPEDNPRIGVDRAARGRVIDRCGGRAEGPSGA